MPNFDITLILVFFTLILILIILILNILMLFLSRLNTSNDIDIPSNGVNIVSIEQDLTG